MRCPGGSGHDVEVVQASREARGGSRAAGSCVARAGAAVEHLPACLAGKQLAGAVLGLAGRWAGCWAPGKLFPFSFCFLFFNTSATLLN